MMARRPDALGDRDDSQDALQRRQVDPPIRLAHVLFVLWVAGSVAWTFFAAKLAHDQGWFVERPELAAILVLAPPILAHFLANYLIRIASNPRLRS